MREIEYDPGMPDPTHDANRDISESSEATVDYALTTGERRQPRIASSYSYRGVQMSAPVEENVDQLAGSGDGSDVEVRSGNAHWDGDDYQLAGASAAKGPTPEEIAAQESNDKVLVIGFLAAAAVLWWISRK